MQKKLLIVFAAMILGFFAGRMTGVDAQIFGVSYYELYSLVGSLFLNALTLVMVPLVAASIITGSYRMAEEHSFGRLGAKTFGLFLGTTAIALLIGWFLAIWIEPGVQQGSVIATSSKAAELVSQANQGVFSKVQEILQLLIPANILMVASKGQMIGLILFCLLFGSLLPKVDEGPRQVLAHFWKGLFQVMIKMTEAVMLLLPIGVFALVAKTSSTLGWDALLSVGSFLYTVLFGLLLYAGVVLSILLRIFGVRPLAHVKAMAPALLTAFSTSSSAATLPVAMECVEKKCGVSNRIASFALPLGTTVNLAGSSLQVIVSVIFIAQVYGVALPFATQCLIFFVAWLLSLSVAAIPSASLISIVVILTTIGLPADGIGLIMVVERILDMCRTTVNVYSNSCCAVMVARSEKESLPIAVR
jgi:proton glutamate symport protein